MTLLTLLLLYHMTAPLPMEDIAKMADECMRDVDDDDDDDNVEDDEDLLVSVCVYFTFAVMPSVSFRLSVSQ